ncbi:MAG: hypothetical protein LAT53_04415 [Idiomarina sp.]|nr:hypothetical protein [Idiomarina sp.]
MKNTAIALLSALMLSAAPAMAQGTANTNASQSAGGTLGSLGGIASIASVVALAVVVGDSSEDPFDNIECFDGDDCSEEPPETTPPETTPPETTPPTTTPTTVTVGTTTTTTN